MKSLSCPNRECSLAGKTVAGKGHRRKNRPSWLLTDEMGTASAIPMRACGKAFCTSTGTPYHGLQHRRATHDEVAALSVDGLNKSAISRVERIAWNTVDRWLERAGNCCGRFNDRKMTGLRVTELQADGIRSIVGSKQQPIWIFVSIDVLSRLWPSTVVGRGSYDNTLTLFRDVVNRMNLVGFPVIATDGFEFNEKVVIRNS